MDQLQDLIRLEEAVVKLLAALDEAKAENDRLAGVVNRKEQDINELNARIDTLQGDRRQIQERVAGLIDSIDSWEKTKAVDESSETTATPAIEENTLF